MRSLRLLGRIGLVFLALSLLWPLMMGCQTISDRLSRWQMLGQEALEDPVQAVGGSAFVFVPSQDDRPRTRSSLSKATPQELLAYYSPVFVQQKARPQEQRYPYPAEYDQIGEARLRQDEGGKFKSYVAGQPTVYTICEKLKIGGHDHVQLTYTAWYPAHPRMKAIDLESASIDSVVLRLTLDNDNAPLFYETIAACGCFHKVFVQRRIEDAATKAFVAPEKGKKFAVERRVTEDVDWEVAGVVDEPLDQPRRPVVFLKAGDHKVLGIGSAARLRVPDGADVHPYTLADYQDLYAVAIDGSKNREAFFDMNDGGKVRGAERKERFVFSLIGVDGAGQPRANNQIKLHFDQSTWSDPTTYDKYLRLPPNTL
jgi:hypothetical protein